MQTSTSSNKRAQRCALAVALFLSSAASTAWADDESVFQEHYQRGLQLYKLNALRPAIKEFVAAYAVNPLPRLLYNLGQLQRKVGDSRDAIDSYELYLRTETELTPARKDEVSLYIDTLRAGLVGSTPAAPSSANPSGAAPAPTGDPVPPSTKAPAPGSATEAPLLLILAPVQSGKAGRYMFNIGIGYAYPFFDVTLNSGLGGLVLRPEMGFALNRNRNAYLMISPQFAVVEKNDLAALTIGFQYDFPILVRGLFLHMTASAGYALSIRQTSTTTTTATTTTTTDTITLSHLGVIIPELGFKYVVNGKVNFGFHPVSLPITINANGAAGSFRNTFYAGYNF